MGIRLPKFASIGSVVNADAITTLANQRPGSIGAIVSDPPFFIGIGRDDHAAHGMGNDPWTKDRVDSHRSAADWYKPLATHAMRALRPGGSTVIMGGSQSIAAWEDAASAAGLRWMAELTVLWNTGKPRQRNFGSLTTTIRWHCKPGGRYAFETEARALYSNVLVCSKVPIKNRLHPAQKPVELTNFLVSLLTMPSDLVMDPYCGSGSTLVSAAMCDRAYLGCDQDRQYCEIAATRAQELEAEEANLRPIYFWANGRLEEV